MTLLAMLAGFATLARSCWRVSQSGVAGRKVCIGLSGIAVIALGLWLAGGVAVIERPLNTSSGHALPDADAASPFINPARPRQAHYVWEALPEQAPEPADNPGNPARVRLGQRLFNETRLSGDRSLSCASCHDLYGHAGADARPRARGIDGQTGVRNTPTVWNAAFMSRLFWDGRAASLEAQAQGPILNPIEMGMPTAAEAERRLQADASYRQDFAQAFGDHRPITLTRIAQAIAAYERTLITSDTPYDRFVRGDAATLTPIQLRGMALFESTGCVLCHRGPSFSDAGMPGGEAPLRLFPVNLTAYDRQYDLLLNGQRGVWRIASLRNVALTGPWLHNGAVDSLDEVVRIMASAQLGRSGQFKAWLNPAGQLDQADHSPLSDRQIAELVAFLEALSSDRLTAAARHNGHAVEPRR